MQLHSQGFCVRLEDFYLLLNDIIDPNGIEKYLLKNRIRDITK